MKTLTRWLAPFVLFVPLMACDVKEEEADTGGVPSTSGDGVACEPFEGCPDTTETSQECEPNAGGDAWECVPQYAGTSPMYGDECWPDESPTVACTGNTICMAADGLGVAGCDGGEGGGCCTQLCDLSLGGDGSCPDAGQICTPFYGDDDPPEGYEHVGVCRLE